MATTWTHKVVKTQRGMQGEWFAYRAAGTFGSEADARVYAEAFAHEQAGVAGTRITVQTRGRRVVASYTFAQCACGEATGEACNWSGPRADTVVIEWMPEHLRASHEAAGNRGVYPHNGALRLRVHPDCAEMLSTETEA